MESTIDSASVFSSSSLLNMLLLSTKVPECNVEAIEWNWSGILLTPDLADTKEWPDPLCRMEEGFSIGSSAHDRNSSWATDEPPGTRLEDEDFDIFILKENLEQKRDLSDLEHDCLSDAIRPEDFVRQGN